jgi:predicted ester cyclase
VGRLPSRPETTFVIGRCFDPRERGRDAVVEYASSWFTAFPDARLEVNDVFAAGDWIVEECTFTGTHTAP